MRWNGYLSLSKGGAGAAGVLFSIPSSSSLKVWRLLGEDLG